jgi:hypothetical protein
VSVHQCQQINDILRAAGVVVHEAPGWQARGNGHRSAYEGGLIHHTATGHGMALAGTGAGRLLMDGRSNLSGPLCNYAGNEDGSLTVIAAHPANHAGASGGRSMGPLPRTKLFNKHVLGLEIVYPGEQPMRDAQYRTAVAWARAVVRVCGRGDAQRIRAHAETSITGKWDPGHAPGQTIDMTAFRNAVASQQEADLTPDEHIMLQFLYDRVKGIMPQRYYVPDPTSPGTVQEVGPGTPNAVAAHVLDTLDGNFILRRLSEQANGKLATPEQLEQLARSVASRVPRDKTEQFTAALRAAFDQPGPA